MQSDTQTTISNEQRSIEYLNSLVSEYLVFIDTCSWMDESITEFIDHLIVALQSQNKAIYLTLGVRNELQKFLDDSSNANRQSKAKRAAREIKRLTDRKLLNFIGDTNDTFTDNILLSVFNKYRLKYKLALVTQDRALCNDILNLNNIQSSRGFPVVVRRINRFGYLSPFSDSLTPTNNTLQTAKVTPNSPAFKICKSLTPLSNNPLKVWLFTTTCG